ncbi:putative ORMDL family protein [Helianthus annuus]|nr:putative ORMDL family protein [Helianthus annuus]KAJ0707571.1 putative ORMDL family protein [Helianthus annuus]KAJ0893248.1 putative ORMDL family protein [Helianthus annuus]
MMYVKATPTTDLNRNTNWFTYPGVWTTYIFIIFFSWLLILSVSGCTPGMAWTNVHFSHFLVISSLNHLLNFCFRVFWILKFCNFGFYGFGYWMYSIDEWFCFNWVDERCPKSVHFFFKFGFRVF